MPIKQAAKKAIKQDKKKRARNSLVKNKLKKLSVKFRKAVEAKDKNKAQELSKELIKTLDKAAQHKIIKKNNAARQKSRLMKKLNNLK